MTTLVDDLSAIAAPHCHGLDITQSWPSVAVLLGASPEPDQIEISAAVKADAPAVASAAEVRAALLAQAEKIIAAYAEAGWHLGYEPAFDFTSALQPAIMTIGGRVVSVPREYGVGLALRLTLVRVGKAPV